jgi:hypothetical protein
MMDFLEQDLFFQQRRAKLFVELLQVAPAEMNFGFHHRDRWDAEMLRV